MNDLDRTADAADAADAADVAGAADAGAADLDADGGATAADSVDDADTEARVNPSGTIAITVVLGIALFVTARSGFIPLLVAVAAGQALLTFSYVFGTAMPGRKGALVLAALGAGGVDTAIALRPGAGMSAVLPVLALLVPAMFVHQLLRGAARNRVVESLGAVALLLLAVVAFGTLLSLSREFDTQARGGQVAGGLALVIAGAVLVSVLTDLVGSRPRFDPDVPHGMAAVVVAAAAGGLIGAKALGGGTEFVEGRGLFVGAAVAALVALFVVAVAFLEHTTTFPGPGAGRRLRPVLGAALPMALGSPIALLICLAIRA